MKFICLTLLLISGDSRSAEQYEVVGAADPVFAFAGENVDLPCSVKPNVSVVDMRVEWFRLDKRDSQLVHLYEDHEDRNTEQIQSYRGRTELIHQQLQRGNASLRLSAVQVSDEGRYKCFIQSKSWSDDTTVVVNVEAVGRHPVISVDGFDHSGGLRLQCESEGWNPEPDLEWLDSKGVRLSPETTETHRNTDGFSVKHSVIVHHRDGKIHCRVKLRHHMRETLISTTNAMFNSWMTAVIVIAVLSLIAGILIAVIVHKYRAYSQQHNDYTQVQNDYTQVQNNYTQIQNDYTQVQNDYTQVQNNYTQIQNDYSQLQNAYTQLQNAKRQTDKEHSRLQKEKGRIQKERNQLLQSQRMIIPKAITHLRQHTAVNVTLDADSAHPHLIVSDDGKQVKCRNTLTGVDEDNNRFTHYLGVVGKEGFCSGCFYYEVQVKNQTEWNLGVTRESADRKLSSSHNLKPLNGYWTVSLNNKKYCARESSDVSLSLSVKPQRVGVFVDYKKGFVSFYDVKSMSHIYSYTDQTFKDKLYPFVCLGFLSNSNSAPLTICDDY